MTVTGKNMLKHMLVALLMSAVCLITAAAGASYSYGAQRTADDENTLREAVSTAGNGDTIVIGSSIQLSDKLEIPEGKDITLKGKNGKEKITINLSSYTSAQKSDTMAVVMVYGRAVMQDITIDAQDHMRAMYIGGGGIVDMKSGSSVINGLVGKNDPHGGAGIRLNGKSSSEKAVLTVGSGAAVKDNKAGGAAREGINGIGVCAYRYAEVIIDGGEISGNKDMTQKNYMYFSSGGGIALEGTGTSFALKSGTIKNNSVKGSGGGVYIDSTDTASYIKGGSISGNTAGTTGGGVYTGSASVEMSGGEISGNTAESDAVRAGYARGGGVYIAASDSDSVDAPLFRLSSGKISGNKAVTDAKSNDNDPQNGQGGGLMVYGTFVMTGGAVSENTAASSNGLKGESANGGGIGIGGGNYPGTVKLSGGSITGNQAQNKGGAIYMNNQNLSQDMMSSVTEDIPQTPGSGVLYLSGGIQVKDNKDMSGKDDNIYLRKGTRVTFEDEMSDKAEVRIGTEVTADGTVIGDTSDDYLISASDARTLRSNSGSRIYSVNGNNKVVISEEDSGEYTDMSSAEIKDVDDSYVYTGDQIKPVPSVTLDGTVLKQGIDYTLSYRKTGYDNTSVSTAGKKGIIRVIGAGKYSGSAEKTFSIGPADISSMRAEAVSSRLYTGSEIKPAVKIYNGSVLLEEGTDYTVSYSDNTAAGDDTAKIQISGKGNYNGSRTEKFTILPKEGVTSVSSQKELQDAAEKTSGSKSDPEDIYVSSDIDLTETLTVLKGKGVHLIGDGDAVKIKASSQVENLISNEGYIKLENITLDADRKGRCLDNKDGATAVIGMNTLIKSGQRVSLADNKGGGISNSGELISEGGEVSGNTAALGGGIYCGEGSTAKLSKLTVRGNTGNTAGGGIYNDGTIEAAAGVVISANKANSSNTNNISGAGGGIYNSGSLVCSSDSEVSGNQATKYGAGIFNTDKAELNDKCVISGNITSGTSSARVGNCGGGIYVAGGKVTMNGGTVRDNQARNRYVEKNATGSAGCGGGVYVSNYYDGAVFEMNGGEITANQAVSSMDNGSYGNGGGVYVMGGLNSEKDSAYRSSPGTMILGGGRITGNSASCSGSGIYIGNKEIYRYSNDSLYTVYEGKALMEVKGSFSVKDNEESNIYLTEGVKMTVTGKLTGEKASSGVISESGGTADIASGNSSYTVTKEDAGVFFGGRGLRTIDYDQSTGSVILKAADLESSGFEIRMEKTDYGFTGSEIKPDITVSDKNGNTLTEKKDYTVEYSGKGTTAKQLINTGEKTVEVTGTGDYTGTLSKVYSVVPRDISEAEVSFDVQIYTGKELTPNPSVIKYCTYTLLKGTDYKVIYANNKNAGTASAEVSGMGNFTGSKTVDFRIAKSVSSLKIAGVSDKAYTGKEIKPSLSIKDGTKTLKQGTDYTLSYSNNKVPGKAKITVTGKNSYTGSRTVNFRIVPKKMTVSKVSSPAKAKITVKLKKDSYASGYQILIAKNSKFTSGKKTVNITSRNTVSKTVSGLAKGKKYYVRARAYKTIDGKKYYGGYSSSRTVTVKK